MAFALRVVVAGTLVPLALTAAAVAPVPAQAQGAVTTSRGDSIVVEDLGGVAGGTDHFGVEVNEQGVVAGFSGVPTPTGFVYRPWVWRRGRLTEIAPPGVSALPSDLNGRGQVAGFLEGGGSAFSWSGGRWSELFTDDDHASAVDVNNRGDVLVERSPASGARYFSLWNDGRVTDFRDPVLEPRSSLVEVNDRRVAAGVASTDTISQRAIVWRAGGQPRFLDPEPVLSTAVAINEAGAVAGYRAPPPSFDATPALWSRGRAVALPGLGGQPTVIGTGLGVAQQPDALNERGRVVGSGVTPGGERHAVLWRHGQAIDLGTLGGTTSEAYALNNRDQVVGDSTTADGQSHAFLWDDGVMHDLGAPVGDVSSVATDIDDRGRVIGHTFEQNGRRAILWVTHLR